MGFLMDYGNTHPGDLLWTVKFFHIMWVFEKRKGEKGGISANQIFM